MYMYKGKRKFQTFYVDNKNGHMCLKPRLYAQFAPPYVAFICQ